MLNTERISLIGEGLGDISADIDTRKHIFQLERFINCSGAWIDQLYREIVGVNRLVLLVVSAVLATNLDRVDTNPGEIGRCHR